MSYGSWHEMSPWRRRPLTIPPNSVHAWFRLAIWEIWMGMLLCLIFGFGVSLIVSSPDRIFTVTDLGPCYGRPPVALPCERVIRGGLLNAAFTTLCGVMLLGVGAWFLWELWIAVAPKRITDDFLRLLNDSFGRDWRKPLTWPWARVLWAYGFTLVGATITAVGAMIVWTLVTSSSKVPTVRVETSQTFTLPQ
jgi:hypothetical protein